MSGFWLFLESYQKQIYKKHFVPPYNWGRKCSQLDKQLIFFVFLFIIKAKALNKKCSLWGSISYLEPLVGFEPTTPRLQITCSGQLS